jgi:type IV pilus biogenesis protein CpaD/CtpE
MPATSIRPLTSHHPKIEQFLRLWHESGREQIQRSMPSRNYDTEHRKIAKDRRQYIQQSGVSRTEINAVCVPS